jgi:hypothetical protein
MVGLWPPSRAKGKPAATPLLGLSLIASPKSATAWSRSPVSRQAMPRLLKEKAYSGLRGSSIAYTARRTRQRSTAPLALSPRAATVLAWPGGSISARSIQRQFRTAPQRRHVACPTCPSTPPLLSTGSERGAVSERCPPVAVSVRKTRSRIPPRSPSKPAQFSVSSGQRRGTDTFPRQRGRRRGFLPAPALSGDRRLLARYPPVAASVPQHRTRIPSRSPTFRAVRRACRHPRAAR